MSKMKVMKPNDDGWCEWVIPRNTYRMGCCDCGLVHDMEFEVIKKIAQALAQPGRNQTPKP